MLKLKKDLRDGPAIISQLDKGKLRMGIRHGQGPPTSSEQSWDLHISALTIMVFSLKI